jgi:amino acid permease
MMNWTATNSNAGPGGALLAYCLIGVMIYFLMTSLGELATHNPTSGAFFTYGTKYVEGGFGFALGWNYWYNWAITVAFELVAVQFIMKFWFPDLPGFYWSASPLVQLAKVATPGVIMILPIMKIPMMINTMMARTLTKEKKNSLSPKPLTVSALIPKTTAKKRALQ